MAQDYQQILNNVEVINWAKRFLTKHDRIVWYLKKVTQDSRVHPCEELRHYYAMNIPEINKVELINQDLPTLLKDFEKIESDYLQKQETDGLIPCHVKDSILLSLPDNYAWVNLKVSYCKQEAEAMGHCGNEGGPSSDQILSLRQKVTKGGKYFWKPHATFILQKGKKLGEMKGKQNKKPHEKYHPQILALLTSKYVNKIEGGGYNPQENFSLLDLPKNTREEFLDKHSSKVKKELLPIYSNLENKEFLQTYNLTSNDREDVNLLVSLFTSEEELVSLALNNPNERVAEEAVREIDNLALRLKVARATDKFLVAKAAFSLTSCSEEQMEEYYNLPVSQNNLKLREHILSYAFFTPRFADKMYQELVRENQVDSELFFQLVRNMPDNFRCSKYQAALAEGESTVELRKALIQVLNAPMIIQVLKSEEKIELKILAAGRLKNEYSILEIFEGNIPLEKEVALSLIRNYSEKHSDYGKLLEAFHKKIILPQEVRTLYSKTLLQNVDRVFEQTPELKAKFFEELKKQYLNVSTEVKMMINARYLEAASADSSDLEQMLKKHTNGAYGVRMWGGQVVYTVDLENFIKD